MAQSVMAQSVMAQLVMAQLVMAQVMMAESVMAQVAAFGGVFPGASIRLSDLNQNQAPAYFVLEWIVYGWVHRLF